MKKTVTVKYSNYYMDCPVDVEVVMLSEPGIPDEFITRIIKDSLPYDIGFSLIEETILREKAIEEFRSLL